MSLARHWAGTKIKLDSRKSQGHVAADARAFLHGPAIPASQPECGRSLQQERSMASLWKEVAEVLWVLAVVLGLSLFSVMFAAALVLT